MCQHHHQHDAGKFKQPALPSPGFGFHGYLLVQRAVLEAGLDGGVIKTLDAGEYFTVCGFTVFPAFDFGPFALFHILLMFKKMGNLPE